MTPLDGLRAALESGRPAATVVHTLWSFVPSLEGTFAPEGYLDVLAQFPANLVFGIPELDGLVASNVTHVGPVFEAASQTGWRRPNPGLPLVVVSMGSTNMGESGVLQQILDALEGSALAVFAITGHFVDRRCLRVSANATVTDFISHSLVLPEADLFIGHAGHGAVMAALAAGLPILSFPLGRDQPTNAAHLAKVGAGITLAADADHDAIVQAVTTALGDSQMRHQAGLLAQSIRRHANRPVEQVEALLG